MSVRGWLSPLLWASDDAELGSILTGIMGWRKAPHFLVDQREGWMGESEEMEQRRSKGRERREREGER